MPRTRVKICGITRPEDALACARSGVDAIGLVFAPRSARYVDIAQAHRVLAGLPPFISIVALFQNPTAEAVRSVLAALPISCLQFHGDESEAFCAAFERPYLKAVPMGAGADLRDYARRFASASALLPDSHGGERIGGTGETFDWGRIPVDCGKPIVLAGGLHAGNVAAAIRSVRPWAVDVSSGVEAAKGIKDAAAIAAFMQGVTDGDSRG